jgi:hypothetical protein
MYTEIEGSMNDNINMNTEIEELMNDNIHMDTKIEGSMNDNINMNTVDPSISVYMRMLSFIDPSI